MEFSQQDIIDRDNQVLSKQSYRVDTWEIIVEMDLSTSEKIDELEHAYDNHEITTADFYRATDLITGL